MIFSKASCMYLLCQISHVDIFHNGEKDTHISLHQKAENKDLCRVLLHIQGVICLNIQTLRCFKPSAPHECQTEQKAAPAFIHTKVNEPQVSLNQSTAGPER